MTDGPVPSLNMFPSSLRMINTEQVDDHPMLFFRRSSRSRKRYRLSATALVGIRISTLVADGLFLESDIFYVMPDIDLEPLVELFQVSVLNMLKQQGLHGRALIKKILSWRYNWGFRVHNRMSVKVETIPKYDHS